MTNNILRHSNRIDAFNSFECKIQNAKERCSTTKYVPTWHSEPSNTSLRNVLFNEHNHLREYMENVLEHLSSSENAKIVADFCSSVNFLIAQIEVEMLAIIYDAIINAQEYENQSVSQRTWVKDYYSIECMISQTAQQCSVENYLPNWRSKSENVLYKNLLTREHAELRALMQSTLKQLSSSVDSKAIIQLCSNINYLMLLAEFLMAIIENDLTLNTEE